MEATSPQLPSSARTWQTPLVIMLAGALVFLLTAGIRQSFGLFLQPLTSSHGWGREVYGLAAALLTLLTGAAAPFFGALADRFGSGRVFMAGGLLWAAGLIAMTQAETPLAFTLAMGLVLGLGAASTSISMIMGAVGRKVPEHLRSRALGIVTAGGSGGQMLVLLGSQALISWLDWRLALVALGCLMLLIVPAALGLAGAPAAHTGTGVQQRMGAALSEAGGHRGFLLLTAGFFVCGFHVSFVAIHLPSFVVDSGLAPSIGALALFLIGLFNIVGAYVWGRLGGTRRKKHLLSTLYALRAVLMTAFFVLPITPVTVLCFAAAMGFTWLGTVPLTSGLVGQIFGVRYLSMLFGIVFFSHQCGGFLGAWLGGYVFDRTHSYDLMWLIAIALAVFSALVHLPIDDAPVERAAANAAPAMGK